jgi:hypothetical protein
MWACGNHCLMWVVAQLQRACRQGAASQLTWTNMRGKGQRACLCVLTDVFYSWAASLASSICMLHTNLASSTITQGTPTKE